MRREWMAMAKPEKTTYASLSVDEQMHREYENALHDVESALGKRYPMHIGREAVSSPEEFTVRS
ncbi:MAG TPA: hypothetical protein VE134_07185, partial [Methanomicrobiales archaeon]|nr:hypothetical protein [Methanomicrobiales archaeon]